MTSRLRRRLSVAPGPPFRADGSLEGVARWLPAWVFLVSSLSADLVAIAGHDPIGIWTILPAGPVAGSWINAEVSSTTLVLVSIALFRGKRVGLWLALALLAGAVVAQGFVNGHFVATGIAIALAAILIATRERYVARSGSRELGLAVMLIGIGGALVLVDAFVTGFSTSELVRTGRLVGQWLDAGAIGRIHLGSWSTIGLVGARLAVLAALALALDPAPDPRTDRERSTAKRVLERLGRGGLHPYQRSDGVGAFTDESRTSALGFARAGRNAVALGDPVGARALDAWTAACRQLDWLPAIYQASDGLRAILATQGWHGIRIGSEAIVDPTTFDLASSRLANVRHTITRARKGGLVAGSSRDGTFGLPTSANVTALAGLDAEWRRHAGIRLGFTVGQFDPADLVDTRIVAAIDADGRLDAFVVLRPTGADGGWALDVMRRRRGAVPGAVELCLATAIADLAKLGVRRLSLGLAPLAGLRAPGDPGAPLDERGLALAARLIRPVYDVQGLAFFKDKFAPSWEPRSLVVPRPWHVPVAAWALLRLHLGGSWPAMARSLLAPLRPARADASRAAASGTLAALPVRSSGRRDPRER